MALPDYNRQFLETVSQGQGVFNNAAKYGVQIKPLASMLPAAKQYWRVVGIYHLTGAENNGNHHVYVDVLGGDGQRINNTRLVLTEENAKPVYAVVDKPANEPGTNFPLWSKTRATVAVEYPTDNPLPSEAVSGIRTDHADEDHGNTWGHHSFYIVYQLTTVPEMAPPPPPPPPPAPSLSLEETIALVGQPNIIPLNPEAMFYKVAQSQKLGERLSAEYDVTYLDKSYRAQIYEKGIVYAEVGDWGNVKTIARTN